MRKIVQFQGAGATEYSQSYLTVLCDDGSMWCLLSGTWTRLPDIPQDEEKNEQRQT